LEHNL